MSKGAGETRDAARWLLLVHQLPAKQAYLRVKVWRRLRALGAVTVKNSVYALPAGEQQHEDFEWLLKEIVEGGGEGFICEAHRLVGLADEEIQSLFNEARTEDYNELAQGARMLGQAMATEDIAVNRNEIKTKLKRLRTDTARVVAIDFFGANGREVVEGLLTGLESCLREDQPMVDEQRENAAVNTVTDTLKGRVWVTRQGVHVDRIASAWLIRRFIDPQAQFKFVSAKDYIPAPGELRFDMYDGEFTHEGDRCTFEVLLARTGLHDPALAALGEIVHDIDLKDGKFGREEASGIARLVDGIAAANKNDGPRIERGAAVLNDLYEYFRASRT